jgi:hypothetical protein
LHFDTSYKKIRALSLSTNRQKMKFRTNPILSEKKEPKTLVSNTLLSQTLESSDRGKARRQSPSSQRLLVSSLAQEVGEKKPRSIGVSHGIASAKDPEN